ncbi:hypothetical protein HPB51_019289 [Rhipicephalus microplus]|uniref:Uncharacterized protein n=1 Tax=Rhipicephalus microplus TaxID=6941 RepID=A0A9J6EUC9_RHIMP|nr:hypothetical protein HPB51_019289 [Rhipicephalus microplus]
MVCIMGERASTPDAFPDDGLCDYVFFDSLYKDGRNMLSRQATFSKSLSNFINNHPAYRGTHLGVVNDKMPMVCIMGERASTPDAFPDDGLCDYIFFDSLYKDGRNMLSRQATFSKSLSNFINNHPAYRGTHLGVGFSFNYLQSAEEDLKVTEPNPLQPLWDEGIYSVGIFDPPQMPPANQTRGAIRTLKKIDDLLQMPKQLGRHAVTALAAADPQLDWTLQYAMDFNAVGITPYIFIAIGHYFYGDNTVRKCFVMPPTRHPLDFPADEVAQQYNFDLGTAYYVVNDMSTRSARARGLLSVTMKGRWNVLLSGAKAGFYELCVSDPSANSFGSYTELCFVRNDFPDLKFGIAVYDIDYDDHENVCASLNRFGRHSRLKQVKKVLDYARLHFGASFVRKACADYQK